MKVFVSYSFGTDEIIVQNLNNAIEKAGHEPFIHDNLTQKLHCVLAEGIDRLDLDMAFRRAGYTASIQERSDPSLFKYLIETLASQDILVILWSDDYSKKYWTRIEWKTALAMCKPLIIIRMDDTPIERDLRRASSEGRLPIVDINRLFQPSMVSSLLDSLPCVVQEQYLGEDYDEITGVSFVKLKHPFLGCFDIGKYEVTNRDMVQWNQIVRHPRKDNSIWENLPANRITFKQASDVCKALNQIDQRFHFRLPTEVEWEYAARAGELTFSGLPQNNYSRFAVLEAHQPMVVGTKSPNAWGLYDMVGNEAEWTLDIGLLHEINGWVQPIPGITYGRAHMVRGGWFGARSEHRASVSFPYPQINELSSEAIGMRLIREKSMMKDNALEN